MQAVDIQGNIFLVGLMGAGKTTVGRALAKKLNMRFADSDHEVEARTGVPIPVIFDIEGEASFRQREADVIRDLTAQRGLVLATGGGAVLNQQSRQYLHSRGTVIYLRASVAHILQRTSHDKSRPLLRTADPRKLLEELTVQREPLYREVAHVVVETGRPNVPTLVQTILVQLAWPIVPATRLTRPTMSQHSSHYLKVALGERSYPIIITPHALDQVAKYVQSSRAMIVTNTTVAPLYLAQVEAALTAAGKQVGHIILPDGESYKNMESLMHIFDVLLAEKCDRKTTLIALGGGASYMRGVPFVQLPTTLLSQVDSSVGGKTGINHALGKNMIGAFYQPQAVLADTKTLHTLAERELSAGLAEVIKHGAITDPAFFTWLEENMDKLCQREDAALAYAIGRSCEIKAEVVRLDEREGGIRAILNFGHTFAHAIESAMGYGVWLHGEAVGCGMVMAADLSWRLGYLSIVDRDRIRDLVQAAGLPVVAPDLAVSVWLDWMQVDKKNEGGLIRFILIKPLGRAVIESVPAEILHATLLCCMQKQPVDLVDVTVTG